MVAGRFLTYSTRNFPFIWDAFLLSLVFFILNSCKGLKRFKCVNMKNNYESFHVIKFKYERLQNDFDIAMNSKKLKKPAVYFL